MGAATHERKKKHSITEKIVAVLDRGLSVTA
jgi:hypothetical protein